MTWCNRPSLIEKSHLNSFNHINRKTDEIFSSRALSRSRWPSSVSRVQNWANQQMKATICNRKLQKKSSLLLRWKNEHYIWTFLLVFWQARWGRSFQQLTLWWWSFKQIAERTTSKTLTAGTASLFVNSWAVTYPCWRSVVYRCVNSMLCLPA